LTDMGEESHTPQWTTQLPHKTLGRGTE